MDPVREFLFVAKADADPGEAILAALAFTRDFLATLAKPSPASDKLLIVIEELVANIARHGGKGRDLVLRMRLAERDERLQLMIEDDGEPFDPVSAPPPSPGATIGDGGVGLPMIHAWSRELTYMRESGINRLSLSF